MAREHGRPKQVFEEKVLDGEDLLKIEEIAGNELPAAYEIFSKQERRKKVEEISEAVQNAFSEEERLEKAALIAAACKA